MAKLNRRSRGKKKVSKKKVSRQKGGKRRGSKTPGRDEKFVLLRVPSPYRPNCPGIIHWVGTQAEIKKRRRALVITAPTQLAILKVISMNTFKPSVVKSGSASFFTTKTTK